MTKHDWKEAWEKEIMGSDVHDGKRWHSFFIIMPNENLDYIYRRMVLSSTEDAPRSRPLQKTMEKVLDTIRNLWPTPCESADLLGERPGFPEAKTERRIWRQEWKTDLVYPFDQKVMDVPAFQLWLSEDMLAYLFEWYRLEVPLALENGIGERILRSPSYPISQAVNRLAEREPDF